MIVFTSICANYGHKARILAESVHRHMPAAKFFLCLTEREIPTALSEDSRFDRIILSREMWEGNFDRFIFKHDIVEASTAVKGAFFQWLMKEYPEEGCLIYLDPDCRVYSDFPEVKEALRSQPAVLCPHLLHPGNLDMELSSTSHGVYNLGFLAVNNSCEAQKMINWWAERLYLYCYDDIPHGVFTDQKWMELAPCFFDVKILRHYGYDLAPWGLLKTSIKKQGTDWQIQGMPLRFIHFSGFGEVAEMCMQKWCDDQNRDFRELYDEYALIHTAMDRDHISQTPWSYSSYLSGETISRAIRESYRKNWDIMFAQDDPFSYSNAYFEEKLGLKQPEGSPPVPAVPVQTSFGHKWQTARQVLQEYGMEGVKSVIADKIHRRKR